MTFAEKLRSLRDERGLSEAKLAQESGVPFGTVHDYGLGRRTPSFPNVVHLARALGVTCEAFADCDDVAAAPAVPTAPPPRRTARKMPGKPGRGRR